MVPPPLSNFFNFDLSLELLDSLVSDLNSSVCSGPDKLPNFPIKKCWNYIREPVLALFNSSLSSGIFPEFWKQVFIQPIFKSNDPHNVTNYRPISVFSSLAKIFDAAVSHHLSIFISNKIITEQHGFVKNKSTLTNLLIFTSVINDAFDVSSQVDAVYTDYQKAFDTVNHDRIIQKLESFGVLGSLLNWFSSYLNNRTLSVRINDSVSFPFFNVFWCPSRFPFRPFTFHHFHQRHSLCNYLVQVPSFCR